MVLKIQRPAERTDGFSPPPPLPPASGEASSYRDDSIVDRLEPRAQFHGAAPSLPPLPPPQRHHRANLVSRSRDPRDVSHPHGGGRVSRSDYQRCDGCGISDKHAPGSLLLFDDPEEEVDQYAPKRPEDEKRYCAKCMTGKKVRVFWPVDSQWYIALVVTHDEATGEHLLQYPDGDTEWVRIGEDHTTNACYYNSLAADGPNGGMSRSGSSGAGSRAENGEYSMQLGDGMSFGLSALGSRSMSQGDFELSRTHTEEEKTVPLAGTSRKSSQRPSYPHLHLTRTTSSMSSFGVGRQHSFHNPDGGSHRHHLRHFQLLSPEFNNSLATKFAEEKSSIAEPYNTSAKRARTEDKDLSKPMPNPYGSRTGENWGRHNFHHKHPQDGEQSHSPFPYDHPHEHARDPTRHPQQREERDGKISNSSPGQRDGPSTVAPDYGDAPSHQQAHPPSYAKHRPYAHYEQNQYPPHHGRIPGAHSMHQPPGHWGQNHPRHGYGAPPSMFSGQPTVPPYPVHPPPAPPVSEVLQPTTQPSSSPSLITPGAPDAVYPSTAISHSHETQQINQQVTSNSDTKQKKAPTKAWTKEEDDQLLDMVLAMKHPLKWSIIASSMSTERTGKQCRERYVNHLNPRLKSTEWTPSEDFTIWRLYATCGTQWAKMSKVIPGRTDNGIKNRYHNLKRQLDREEESRLRAPEPKNYERKIHVNKIRELPKTLKGPIDKLWNVNRGIGMIAAMTVEASSDEGGPESPYESMIAAQKSSRFGPFEQVSGTDPVQCLRCGLYMPSVQCGTEMCTKTRWCKTCTMVPMHLGGHILRECLNLRKCQDSELASMIEKLS
ncbi:hypothetical protein ACHAXS_003071 [Conticribra weissflogii]